jgi:hypothetical protein
MVFDSRSRHSGRSRATRLAWALVAATLMTASGAAAQGIRSLGMGGATAPGHAGATNPAFAAVPDLGGGIFLPLPLGAVNALLRPEFDPRGDQFDILTVFDQMTHLDTLLVNPARSPDEVIVSISKRGGVPIVSIDLVGGAPLQVSEGVPAEFGHSIDLPVGFEFGTFGLGIRPYFETSGELTPGDGFEDLFEAGASSGTLDGRLNGEAGVGVSLSYASAVPIPAAAFPGQIFLGVRAEPFVGMLRVDATGSFRLYATENDAGETEYAYSYQGEGFVAAVGQGGMGYGLGGDVGFALTMPTPEGRFTAGLSVTDLGIARWNGVEISVEGDSLGNYSETPATAASRTYLLDDYGIYGNAAMEFDPRLLGISGLGSLLLAADGSYDKGLVSAHLGAEAAFDAGLALLMVRTGVGFDSGLVAGVGAGFRVIGIGLDAAIHTYRSPFTANQAVGASIGLGFGF